MWTEVQQKLNEIRELMELSWTLGIRRDPPVSCVLRWSLVADPLSSGPLAGEGAAIRPATAPLVAVGHDLQDVLRWIELLVQSPQRQLDVTKRRLQSALAGRLDDTDAFVDAVVSWENMVGGQGSEIRFRVSTTMAWLISEEDTERLQIQARIAKLYDIRSQVVHGARHLDSMEAKALRIEALGYAVGSFRRLLAEFPELVGDKDRSIKLLARLSSNRGLASRSSNTRRAR